MLKQIGLSLCAAAAAGVGVLRAVELYRRTQLLRALARFADALLVGVSRYAWDQLTIFRRFEDPVLERRGFLPCLLREAEARPQGALVRAADTFFKKYDPGKEAREILCSFASSFGALGLIEQIEACERLCRMLGEIAARENKELFNGMRLSLAAGACAGFGLLILFW